MNNVKKIVMIALLFLLVGGIGSIITFNFTEPTSVAEAKEVDDTNITAIDIQSNNERVEIIPAKDQKIRIELSGRSNDKKKNLSVEENGNTLFIQTDNQNHKLFNFGFFTESLTLTVYLPEKLYDTLIVEIDNGSLEAEALNIKDIKAASKNGRIDMENITAETVQVKTDNGKIALSQVEGEITGKTSNGAISLETKSLDQPLELETDNGSIKVQTEKEPTNAIFDVRTDNGSVKVFGDSNWETVVGNGDNLIKLKTDNGSIRVEK
ncbi:hypothetical protein CIL05_18930 [Virgibacillus profundi]|uniref:DUF4097 domain-containing protein n=1 Tax=Virgibacillus profundi TaxID=2024555 RepID=A0A2A2I8H9_9BACI|nr:DUF4097 family beta strand repeat-containing protein [Virgibacillus profundi]PAV27947.1 hypothetical protein CIL05_18930 [Virgibacillus profundi]PXY52125.1 hypothetical protein CIT14_19030 [Virgibacillus profundi]